MAENEERTKIIIEGESQTAQAAASSVRDLKAIEDAQKRVAATAKRTASETKTALEEAEREYKRLQQVAQQSSGVEATAARAKVRAYKEVVDALKSANTAAKENLSTLNRESANATRNVTQALREQEKAAKDAQRANEANARAIEQAARKYGQTARSAPGGAVASAISSGRSGISSQLADVNRSIVMSGAAAPDPRLMADGAESADRLSDSLRGVTQAGVGLTVVSAGGILATRNWAKATSDAAESENLVAVSFGESTGAINDWSLNLQNKLGINGYNLRKTAGDFNLLFKSVDIGGDKALDMSKDLSELAIDLASLRNTSDEEAVTRLTSGLVGEHEALRRLGVFLTEASTKQYAYTHSIAESGAELTEQQKILSRYGQILEQTNKQGARGDRERTAGSAENVRKRAENEGQLAAIAAGAGSGEVETGLNKVKGALAGIVAQHPGLAAVGGAIFSIGSYAGGIIGGVLAVGGSIAQIVLARKLLQIEENLQTGNSVKNAGVQVAANNGVLNSIRALITAKGEAAAVPEAGNVAALGAEAEAANLDAAAFRNLAEAKGEANAVPSGGGGGITLPGGGASTAEGGAVQTAEQKAIELAKARAASSDAIVAQAGADELRKLGVGIGAPVAGAAAAKVGLWGRLTNWAGGLFGRGGAGAAAGAAEEAAVAGAGGAGARGLIAAGARGLTGVAGGTVGAGLAAGAGIYYGGREAITGVMDAGQSRENLEKNHGILGTWWNWAANKLAGTQDEDDSDVPTAASQKTARASVAPLTATGSTPTTSLSATTSGGVVADALSAGGSGFDYDGSIAQLENQKAALTGKANAAARKQIDAQIRSLRLQEKRSKANESEQKKADTAQDRLETKEQREAKQKAEEAARDAEMLSSLRRGNAVSAQVDTLTDQVDIAKKNGDSATAKRKTLEIDLLKARAQREDDYGKAALESDGKHRKALEEAADLRFSNAEREAKRAASKVEATGSSASQVRARLAMRNQGFGFSRFGAPVVGSPIRLGMTSGGMGSNIPLPSQAGRGSFYPMDNGKPLAMDPNAIHTGVGRIHVTNGELRVKIEPLPIKDLMQAMGVGQRGVNRRG